MPRKPPKKRTIPVLPVDALDEASERTEQVLNGYKKAFSGLSDEEMAILDGVILE